MKKKPIIILLCFALLTLLAAGWQIYEAANLESRLKAIDKQAQLTRLLELSLPRVQEKMQALLHAERAKLGFAPPVEAAVYPMPEGGMADFNCGFFLVGPSGVQVPPGQEGFATLLNSATAVIDTIRRKAYNPSAPIYDPAKPTGYDPRTQLPIFGVYEAMDPDFTQALQLKGNPGPFFAWHYGDNLVYMRSVPTTHGSAAEGFIIDAKKLSAHLLPLVETALKKPEIAFPRKGEAANLSPLPLVLRPGSEVELPDTAARAKALSSSVSSIWFISLLTISILFALLAFYTRIERRRADFVSAVTHELRTPLTSFSLITEMLHQNKVPAEKADEYHETLYQESRRLGHLVENVLAFARLTRGKIRGRQDAGPCIQLLAGVIDKITPRLKNAGFQVTFVPDKRAELLTLHTDILSIEQILTNLADNAIKYAATAAAPAIAIHVVRGHDTLSLRFTDNGPGIPANLQRQLFRPFSRSAQATAGRKPGIGLGLALSRDIARSIGGELSLEKTDSGGTTFLLQLPLTK